MARNGPARFLSPEALARRSAGRPWTTIGIWVLVMIIAIALIASLVLQRRFLNLVGFGRKSLHRTQGHKAV